MTTTATKVVTLVGASVLQFVVNFIIIRFVYPRPAEQYLKTRRLMMVVNVLCSAFLTFVVAGFQLGWERPYQTFTIGLAMFVVGILPLLLLRRIAPNNGQRARVAPNIGQGTNGHRARVAPNTNRPAPLMQGVPVVTGIIPGNRIRA